MAESLRLARDHGVGRAEVRLVAILSYGFCSHPRVVHVRLVMFLVF